MAQSSFRILSIVIAGLFIVSSIPAQNKELAAAAGDKYVISAKAGGVNYTEGRVTVARQAGRSGELLKRDTVDIGDVVTTGVDGRAEILLNPGSFMRAGADTQFSFVSTSLDDLQVKLDKGDVVFEVIADDDFKVSVASPKGAIDLTRSGVYRIDVAASGETKLSVTKGTAFVGSAKTEVKSGRTITLLSASETSAVAKLDKDQKDDLDTWSKGRAKELAKVNSSLQRKDVRSSLMSSFMGRGWNMYDSFGLWVFDPFRGYSCFMPFGYGWGSPYGFGYGYDFWTIGMPTWIYYVPPPYRRSPQPPATTPTGATPPARRPMPRSQPANTTNTARGGGSVVPPYRRIEGSRSTGGATVVPRRSEFPSDGFPGRSTGGSSTGSSGRSSSPSGGSIPAPVSPAPPPARLPRGKGQP